MLDKSIFEAIDADSFSRAAKIADWYLWEAKRFFEEHAIPQDLMDAVRLDDWLRKRCKKDGANYISRREIQRNVIPTYLRKDGSKLTRAIVVLENLSRLKVVSHGKSKLVFVNPTLLETEN